MYFYFYLALTFIEFSKKLIIVHQTVDNIVPSFFNNK